MRAVKCYEFQLRIAAAQYLDFYRGAMRQIVAKSVSGQTVQFPASLLQQHVGHEGIHGRFILTVGENNKYISLERVKV
jgi:hypothetical protein